MNKLFANISKSLNLKENPGSRSITLEDIIKNLFFTRVFTRLEKLMKARKSLLSNK